MSNLVQDIVRRSSRAVGYRCFLLLLLVAVLATACGDSAEIRGFEPVDSLVAIQPDGESSASTGFHQLQSGAKFSLHAVLRAEKAERELYFTDAPALVIDGRQLPAEQVRPWPEDRISRVRWFTIEGGPPYIDWQIGGRFPHYQAVFRPEWGSGWKIPGDIRPRNSNLALGAARLGPLSFGTSRFYIRIETYGKQNPLAPTARFESPSVLDEGKNVDPSVPGIVMSLPIPLTVPSQVFGLAQVEGLPSQPQTLQQFRALAEDHMTFSRAWVLEGLLSSVGKNWEQLEWSALDLSGQAPQISWGDGLQPGDLLRAGGRVVFAFQDTTHARPDDEDTGELIPGFVDYSDLCLDFSRGAAVRPLNQVFSGGGEVEWARLGGS